MRKRPTGHPARPRMARRETSTGLANPTPRTGSPAANFGDVGPDQIVNIQSIGNIAVSRHVNKPIRVDGRPWHPGIDRGIDV